MKHILLLFLLSFLFLSCLDKKNEPKVHNNNESGWRDVNSINLIPDEPVRGFFNGREVKFQYISFEKWNGPNDNVINFSLSKPEQSCGFIEKYEGFKLMNKGNTITQGEWLKSKFTENANTYEAFYKSLNSDGTTMKSNSTWNCALVIENFSDKIVRGKILLCFNDEMKSWVAGKFEATICNN